ncbi:Peptidase, M23/M37 family [Rhodovulum sp. P5]|uniref:murein hydrolase activator EnvC family protein n=1 Tax=Rhodovulum sp. P5 TaxID=1564506 RepID=UPI0009C2C052|nr:peptidoglycan DD-metalloendopeptidase family protein [Rhodovulum sp. P5]ARE41256.1 Peptidase, M23/M37 family [Rhodovulum sp. P5]
MRRARGPLLALILAGATGVALAQPGPAETARAAAEAMRAASRVLEGAETRQDRVAALTETVQAYEAGLAALRAGLRSTAIRERALRLDLEGRQADISRLLAILGSMQRAPEAQILLHPQGPVAAARAGMLLGHVTPVLQAEAEALRGELEEIALMRALQESAEAALADGLAEVQTARTALSQAISERRDLPRRFTADAARMQVLLLDSETLDAFAVGLTRLAEDTAPDAAPAGFASLKGRLPLPADATVLRGFDQPDAAGIRRPGLVLATRPLALVTAPVTATIRYRGPLLDYGNVMILEPAEGYLLVLAGLAQVYGAEGEVLPAGHPVGLMGGEDPTTAAFPATTTEGGGDLRTETLYMELREGGRPVDPAPWFAQKEN